MSSSEDFKGFSPVPRTQLPTSTLKANDIHSSTVKDDQDKSNGTKKDISQKLIIEEEKSDVENSLPKPKKTSIFSPSSNDSDIENLDTRVISRKRKATRIISSDSDREDDIGTTNNPKVSKLNLSPLKTTVMSTNPKSKFDIHPHNQQLNDVYIAILEKYSSILDEIPPEVLEKIPDFDPAVFNILKTLKTYVEYKRTKAKIKIDRIRISKRQENKKVLSPLMQQEASESAEAGINTKKERQTSYKRGKKRYPTRKTTGSAKRPRMD